MLIIFGLVSLRLSCSSPLMNRGGWRRRACYTRKPNHKGAIMLKYIGPCQITCMPNVLLVLVFQSVIS